MNRKEAEKFLKNRNNRRLLIIIITGIALMIFCDTGKKTDDKVPPSEIVHVEKEEARLEKILEKIEGVGEVSVMISYEETAKKNIAYEKNTSASNGEIHSYDEKAVMSDGEPLVINERYPAVKGVVITAEGADNPKVRRELTDAVSAVLGVGVHRVCVFKKSSD